MSGPSAFRMSRDALVVTDPDVIGWIGRALREEIVRAERRGVGRPPLVVHEVAQLCELIFLAAVPSELPAGSVRGGGVVPAGWLSSKEVGDRLGLSDRQVRNLIRGRQLEAVRGPHGWAVSPESVEDVMRRRQESVA